MLPPWVRWKGLGGELWVLHHKQDGDQMSDGSSGGTLHSLMHLGRGKSRELDPRKALEMPRTSLYNAAELNERGISIQVSLQE